MGCGSEDSPAEGDALGYLRSLKQSPECLDCRSVVPERQASQFKRQAAVEFAQFGKGLQRRQVPLYRRQVSASNGPGERPGEFAIGDVVGGRAHERGERSARFGGG